MSYTSDQTENLISLEDRDVDGIEVNWSLLPSTVVENIYTHLDFFDRINMSLVCKNWSREYGSPGVWEVFYFSLSNQSKIWSENKFARKFGYMFKHVKITGRLEYRALQSHANKVLEQLRFFLQALIESKCRLFSLEVSGIGSLNKYLDDNTVSDLAELLACFIRTQKTLRVVKFYDSLYKRAEAIKVLTAVCENDSRTLEKLVLHGYTDQFEDATIPLFPISIASCFMSLKTLNFNYCQFFEESMRSILQLIDSGISFENNLQLIYIGSEEIQLEFDNGTPPLFWKRMRKLCPLLRVKMCLRYDTKDTDLINYLSDYIPLNSLIVLLGGNNYLNTTLDSLFRKLCSCHAYEFLEYVRIIWYGEIEDVSTSLIPLLQVSKKLIDLRLNFMGYVAGLKEVFEYLLNDEPESLKSIEIYLHRVNESDQSNLMIISEKILPLLKLKGLSVSLFGMSYNFRPFNF